MFRIQELIKVGLIRIIDLPADLIKRIMKSLLSVLDNL